MFWGFRVQCRMPFKSLYTGFNKGLQMLSFPLWVYSSVISPGTSTSSSCLSLLTSRRARDELSAVSSGRVLPSPSPPRNSLALLLTQCNYGGKNAPQQLFKIPCERGCEHPVILFFLSLAGASESRGRKAL